MKRRKMNTPTFSRILAWIVLALFALTLLGFVNHIGCSHFHDAADGPCPFCESFFQTARLLRLAGLAGLFIALLNLLGDAGTGKLFCKPELSFSATLVSLRVKLLD